MGTIMADALLKRSKNDPKVRMDRMDRKAGQAAARSLPSAFAGLFASVLTAPFGITPNYKGTRMMDRFDRMNANGRGAGQIRGAFGMMDTENAVQKKTDTGPQSAPRADHGKAYLNSAAKAKATKAPMRSAPARASGPAGQSGARGPTSYTTLDGRTVQGTEGQIAAWKSRRK